MDFGKVCCQLSVIRADPVGGSASVQGQAEITKCQRRTSRVLNGFKLWKAEGVIQPRYADRDLRREKKSFC